MKTKRVSGHDKRQEEQLRECRFDHRYQTKTQGTVRLVFNDIPCKISPHLDTTPVSILAHENTVRVGYSVQIRNGRGWHERCHEILAIKVAEDIDGVILRLIRKFEVDPDVAAIGGL